MKRTFFAYLEKNKIKVEKNLERFLPRKINNQWLKFVFGKVNYKIPPRPIEKAILRPLRDFIFRGGKRWRPCLFLLLSEAFGQKINKTFEEIAVIPEIIHNGTLIIDDIEDRAELRRGKPVLHKIFGVDIAINAGNFIHFFPLLIFEKHKKKFPLKTRERFYQLYIQEMTRLHGGQAIDIYWHQGRARCIEVQEYLQMCAFKTGSLARFSARLAAVLTNQPENIEREVGSFAETIGIAFQIQDDILDLKPSYADKKFGKAFGNDIEEGKRSLPVIYSLAAADNKDRKDLLAILEKKNNSRAEKLRAIRIIEKYRGTEKAELKAKELLLKGWQRMDKILDDSPAKKRLQELTRFLIERKF
jgi:geranylgeranyl diphosphate synthase type I